MHQANATLNFLSTAVFKIPNAAGFLWEHMDDAHIIYDTRSGHSQALNDFAREIFDIIEDKPRSLPEILVALELILERPIEDDLKQQILKTVTEFDKMGLIEPVNLHNENI
ncbi:hypothetical protein MNBD_ALPHA03-153 [hydrothermal vent metagenome]|uniref:HPr-rel-A system PqqD family protein n=1 Tax=hydrothermal vent metagenome TaxID=652676 RepID=A0A3B1ARL5_9ZZZZ